MSVRRSAGAIFWGLTLVGIGVLLLANNMGYPIHIWSYVVRYWPALLIAWGLLKFVDYFRFRHAGDSRPLFSGGEVALLILVIFTGSAITTAANVSPEIGNIFDIGDIDLWDITGNNFTYDQHREETAAPGSEIEIVNLFGSVEVRPAESDRIAVDVKKTVRAANQQEADRLERDFTFSILKEDGKYRIVSNRDGSGFSGSRRQRFKSSLMIQVPKRSALHLDNRNGRVFVDGLTGDQNIVNRYGEVEVQNITGQLQLENRNGTVTVENVSAAVVVSNRYANTTVKNIGGDLRIQSRNGSVDVADVKGTATIDNSYAPVNVKNVEGGLTMSGHNNSVDVEHIEGDVQSSSSYENVTIKDPRAAVSVSGRNGDILLSFERAPRKDISIDARYANVTIELPSRSAFKVDARTEYGDVQSDFEGLSISRSNRDRNMNGEVRQGGPHIEINTRNGDIRLQRRG